MALLTLPAAMVIQLLRTLYQYNTWANARILDTAAQLPPHELLAPGGASFGSIRDTLVHTMGAQWLWLARWQGTSPTSLPDAQDFPDLDSIRRHSSPTLVVDDAQLARWVTYVNFQGEHWEHPLWQQRIHQVNHATQHRSEVAAMLTQFGHSPGWLDFLYFLTCSRRANDWQQVARDFQPAHPLLF